MNERGCCAASTDCGPNHARFVGSDNTEVVSDAGVVQENRERRSGLPCHLVHDLATAAVEAAINAGARYADARVMESRAEAMSARNGVVEALDRQERAGVGVRALIGSSWGFFAIPDASPAGARRAGEQAAEVARASASVPGKPLDLAPEEAAHGSWASECLEDPW